nr:hypothetical protein [uncultured Prevotella sp.]
MAYTENLQIYKDTFTLCKLLLNYSKTISKIVRYGQFEVAIGRACTALDLVRRINSSFEDRERNLNEFILCLSEVKSRITLFAEAQFLSVKAATNLNYVVDKVLQEGYGWLKSTRNRKGESYRATAR